MPKNLKVTITPQGGEIDKYQLMLLDMANNYVDMKTFTPPFGSSLTGVFTGLADNTQYKIDRKAFIGSMVNNCEFVIVSTTNPVVNITGNIQGVGKSIEISNLSQQIGCDVTFQVDAVSEGTGGTTPFTANITLVAGNTDVTLPDADGNNGVVIGITPTSSGGTTYVTQFSCNGVTYVYTLAINGASAPFLFDYGATLADTTGAPLTEQEYIDSVDDVYLVNGEVHGIAANSGDDVVVNSFGNGTDQVLFIQVAASEAPFTKWSEVGNPFQQNQLIDGAFGLGSNVWFMSTRDGKRIYITRSQTSFVGAVVLSR